MSTQIIRFEFEKQFPMIKIFEVESALYVYDGKSGMLAEITLEEIDQIYNYHVHAKSDNIPDYLKNLLDDGVFLPGSFKSITPVKEELDRIISNQIEENVPGALINIS